MTEPPLSARVDAPAELRPAAVTGVTWRPAELGDIDAVVELSAAIAAADHPGWSETRDEIELEFRHSYVDLPRDSLLGESGGVLVAFGQNVAPPDPETVVRSVIVGGVHPAHRGRGIGRALLAWQEGRGRQQLAESGVSMPGWIMAYSFDHDDSASRLLVRGGFAVQRYFSQLSRDLSQSIPGLRLPSELTLVPYADRYSEATLTAKNEAFRDHWGSQPTTREQWDGMRAMPVQRPELSFLAVEGERVVGFVMVEVNEDDWDRQGFTGAYISLVGVVAGWRRRGVAPALLAASLAASRDAGLERSVLDVDSDSPTGALSLYTGMGFTRIDGSQAHVMAF